MDYTYRITNKVIRLQSDIELIENKESAIFRCEGQEEIDLNVQIQYVDEMPRIDGTFVVEALDTELYRKDDRLYLVTKNRKDNSPMFISEFSSQKDDAITLWALREEIPHTLRIQAIWSAINLPYQLLLSNILTLHSSVIEVDGQAIVFFAPSRTGKSTQARLWNTYRQAVQLNGDKTALLYKEGNIYASGLPFCGTSDICHKYELPLRALIFLSQAKENVIRPMKGVEALKVLLDNCFGYRTVSGCMLRMIDLGTEIVKRVPVLSLACTPDERAVEVLEKYLKGE